MTRSEMALWPHPAQSVVLLPRYDWSSRPIRFSFFPGGGAVIVISDPSRRAAGNLPCLAHASTPLSSPPTEAPSWARMVSVMLRASMGKPL